MKPMKKPPLKNNIENGLGVMRILSLLFVLMFVAYPYGAVADKTKAKKSSDKEPITINSDNATAMADKKVAEFTGNVHVVQGESELKADKLILYFHDSSETDSNKKNNDTPKERIKKIIAIGNVFVSMQDKSGECERAEYTAATETIILTGKKTVLRDGKNKIIGEKIVYNRKTGKIDVGGAKPKDGKRKRVQAVFYTDGKGLQ